MYPAHPKYSAAVFSPIGQTMMLDPTNVPGQHSITVHDPQASGHGTFGLCDTQRRVLSGCCFALMSHTVLRWAGCKQYNGEWEGWAWDAP